MQRRHFLQLAGMSSMVMFSADPAWSAPGTAPRALVLLELKGGNDGLNTLVPHGDDRYYNLRPRLAIARNKVLKINNAIGLHPELAPLMAGWKATDTAWIQGVGYDAPNRSHFRSIDIWETASASDDHLTEGWLTQVFSGAKPIPKAVSDAIILGESDSGPLRGGGRALAMDRPAQLERVGRSLGRLPLSKPRRANAALRHVLNVHDDLVSGAKGVATYRSKAPSLGTTFPAHPLGRQLQQAAKLIAAGTPVAVFKVSHKGYDTHAGQPGVHGRLMRQLGGALAAFREAMIAAGRWDDVLVMTYSEFGRRAAQNGSMGTDHGTAAPHLMMGGRVKGGLYGKYPALDDLAGGDLKHHVDFRQLYATIAKTWWGLRKMPATIAASAPLPLLR